GVGLPPVRTSPRGRVWGRSAGFLRGGRGRRHRGWLRGVVRNDWWGLWAICWAVATPGRHGDLRRAWGGRRRDIPAHRRGPGRRGWLPGDWAVATGEWVFA